MWTATKDGYFSVVAHRNDIGPGGHRIVQVRARSAEDLRRVRDAGYKVGRIIALTQADYPYRAEMTKAEWSRYITDQVDSIEYTNFKNAVAARDPQRAKIYLKVWSALEHIEDDDWDRDLVPIVASEENDYMSSRLAHPTNIRTS